jgi:hypothetical protein
VSRLQQLLVASILFAVLAAPAYAYIDPGSGSMILQGFLAAIAAVALTAKLWWHRLLVMLGVRKRTLPEKRPPADKK